jgi:hypothetical protein
LRSKRRKLSIRAECCYEHQVGYQAIEWSASMKVTNWRRKLAAALFAGGVWVPSMASAQVIPLGDASFEDFLIGANTYAYADEYRPVSAWIDDLDLAGEDDDNSNWLYDAAYAEVTTYGRRGAPRTGNQAMNGGGNYSAQETSAVFEAGKTYSFSIWTQGDDNATTASSNAFLYVFDGTLPFSDANALSSRRYAPDTGDFINRPAGATPAQSKASWTHITLFHTVATGAPEIGHSVGVGFWGTHEGSFDDASLRVDPAQDVVLVLEVNTSSGQTAIRNQTGESIHIDYYEITSAGNSLNESGWNSFQNPSGNPSGFPSHTGGGNGWLEAGGSSDAVLSESYLAGNSAVANAATISLGAAYTVGDPQDLVFRYGAVSGTSGALEGDYNGDNAVDAADYVVWRESNLNGAQGYSTWRTNFGRGGGPSGASALITGFVRYINPAGNSAAVPEPATVVLAGAGFAAQAVGRRRKRSD